MCIAKLIYSLPPVLRPILPIFGGILVHLTLGTFYSIGNMNPYLASYLRIKGNDTDITYARMSFFVAFQLTGQGCCMFIGGILGKTLGPRLATLIGCAILSTGVCLTYFTINVGYWPTVLSYSMLFGCGVGIAYTGPLVIAMRWLPGRKGLANGIIVAGFGLGAFVFNQIQTFYVNPNNQKPNLRIGQDKYFEEDDILDKLPSLFLLLGGAYTAMQLCGCLLLVLPESPPESAVSVSQSQPTNSGAKNMERKLSEPKESSLMLNEEKAKVIDEVVVTPTPQERSAKVAEVKNYTPLEMIKSPTFYIIWLGFFCLGQVMAFVTSFYKTYGQTFIADDSFLALVGSFASICNASARILWGGLADRFSFKIATCVLSGILTLLLLTMQAVHYGGQIMYFIWVCGIYLCVAGIFALYPAATATFFGQLHFGVNYGVVFTAQVITGMLSAFLATGLLSAIGYSGLFFVVAGFSVVALAVTLPLGLDFRRLLRRSDYRAPAAEA